MEMMELMQTFKVLLEGINNFQMKDEARLLATLRTAYIYFGCLISNVQVSEETRQEIKNRSHEIVSMPRLKMKTLLMQNMYLLTIIQIEKYLQVAKLIKQ